MMNVSCHYIAEKQINIQDTKHIIIIKNDTDTGEIYDADSLLIIVLCNPREFHSVCKPVAVTENFICTLNKKEIPIASCRADDNGAYIRKGTAEKVFKVAFDEIKTKVISARICKVDASGSLEREKERKTERQRETERDRERGCHLLILFRE